MSHEAKTSGLKAPSKISKPSGLPKPSGQVSASSSRAHSPELPSTGSKDSFNVGDRVFVGGAKGGVVAYIGETQFAAGDWAGVILDTPDGKNDGTVQGVRYFQCDAKRGVFSRPSKLTRHKINVPEEATSNEPATSIAKPNTDHLLSKPKAPGDSSDMAKPSDSASGLSKAKESSPGVPLTKPRESIASISSQGSSLSLPKTNGALGSNISLNSVGKAASVGAKHIKVGDRVMVSGTKVGTLRFLGTTEFAVGEWAGVELEEPNGKNDGTVGNKRYFECKPLYGLFAPVHKVTKFGVLAPPASSSPTQGGRVTPSIVAPVRAPRMSVSSLTPRERTLSQESLTSLGSVASTASRSRLTASRVAQARKAYASVTGAAPSASTAALQKALKEKEEHIEQLLKEREMERSEVFRTSSEKDENTTEKLFQAEEQLARLQAEYEAFMADSDFKINDLQTRLDAIEEEKASMKTLVDDQKMKLEDLQFRVEEEEISKCDLEETKSKEEESILKLQNDVTEERNIRLQLELENTQFKAELEAQRSSLVQSEASLAQFCVEMEELRQRLVLAERQLLDKQRQAELGSDQCNELLSQSSQKDGEISTLKAEVSRLQRAVEELNEGVVLSNRANTQLQDQITEASKTEEKLTSKLSEIRLELQKSIEQSASLTSDIEKIKLQLSDTQRHLESSDTQRSALQDQKLKLEQQVSDLMLNSGDNSEQLTRLNNELRDKDRKLEALQEQQSSSAQKAAHLQELLDLKTDQHQAEVTSMLAKHKEVITSREEKIQSLEEKTASLESRYAELADTSAQELMKIKANLTARAEEWDSRQRKYEEEIIQYKRIELELKMSLDSANQLSEQIHIERDSLQSKLVKVEQEKSSLLLEFNKTSQEKLAEQEAHKLMVSDMQSRLSSQQDDVDRLHIQFKKESESLSQHLSVKQKELEEAIGAKSLLESDVERWKLAVESGEERIKVLHSELRTSQEQASAQIENITRQCQEEAQSLTQRLTECQNQIASQKQQLDNAQRENLRHLEREKSLEKIMQETQADLTEANVRGDNYKRLSEASQEEAEHLRVQNDMLSESVNVLKQEFEQMKTRSAEENSSLATRLHAKQEEAEAQAELITQYEAEINALRLQAQASSRDANTIQSLKKAFEQSEDRKQQLLQEVEDLTFRVDELTQTASVNRAAGYDGVKDLATDAQIHIDFLNSVIVERQKRIDELERKVAILAEVEHNDYNHLHDVSSDLDSSDVIQSGRAPRLFCDICDMFDLHDTDDCPVQAQSDSPPASHYGGDRGEERAYCNSCEVFGHWTDDCTAEDEY